MLFSKTPPPGSNSLCLPKRRRDPNLEILKPGLWILVLLFLLVTHKSLADVDLLRSIESKYQQSKSITANVKKILFVKTLNSKKETDGKMFIKSGGRLRLEFDKPSLNLVVLNSKELFSVQYPEDPEFDDKIRVLKSTRPQETQSQFVLTFILGKGGFLEHFKIKKAGENGDFFFFQLEPKSKKSDITNLKIEVDRKNLVITQIRFWDRLENETAMNFSKVMFDETVSDKLFEFEVPKGAEVTEI
jgi:outer membrane lipoprotein-sorting protein